MNEDLSKSERTREAILSAAARLFRYESYYATTMRDIAQEAGVEAAAYTTIFNPRTRF
ncbi:TetR family transcriptional regulator [Sulfitobacter porphyrae]|uniref:TetR family transcriptional regulator n=1 Tax=Sulfitobacter porphyrae TaxID=1246864 RepID=A0ABW2BDC8_9RHOB